MPNLSTLQIGLIIIGAILVLAVWGYNLLQERRIRKRMDAAFKTEADPLLDPPQPAPAQPRERLEPSFAGGGVGLWDAAGAAERPVARVRFQLLHLRAARPRLHAFQ